MKQLGKTGQPDRSKINIDIAADLKHWSRALDVSKDEIRLVVDKVGNGAATVRKELDHRRRRLVP